MRVILSTSGGGSEDISEMTGAFETSTTSKEASRVLDTDFLRPDINPLLPGVRCALGDTVEVIDDEAGTIFKGVLWEIEAQDNAVELGITCYDMAVFLNKNEPPTQVFTDETPEAIATKICEELGLTPGEFAPGQAMTVNGRGRTGYDIIMMAYTKQAQADGKKYKLVAKGDEINVYESGKKHPVVLEELDGPEVGKLLNTSYRQSMDELVNAVTKVNETEDDEKEDNDEDEASQEKFGRIHKIMRGEPDEINGAMESAKTEVEVEVIADWEMVTGKSIDLKSTIIEGEYYIISDTHHYRDGVHTAELTLSTEYEMDEKTEEQREQDEQAFGGSGRVPDDTVEGKMWNILRGMGYSQEAAAVIISNAKYESGFNTSAVESGNTGEGRGLFQWGVNARWKELQAWAGSQGMDPTDLETQIRFMDHEMRTNPALMANVGGYEKFKNETSIDEAARMFYHGFERPKWNPANYEARRKDAHAYYDKFEPLESRSAGGYVGKGNFPQYNYKTDPRNGGYKNQCTYYVYNRVYQLTGQSIGRRMGNGGEWGNYARSYGMPVSKTPKPGTAMVQPPNATRMSGGTYGHVAFVEEVHADGSVTTTEMWGSHADGRVHTVTYSPSEVARSEFIDFGI